jgi:hypothetical protein
VTEENFKIVSTPIPTPAEGQILVRNHYLSLDPYMRGRMNDTKSYAAKQEIDQVMVGGTVGEVVESKNPKFKAGDIVVGMYGWQQYGCSDGTGVNKVDVSRVPMSAYLGVIGMPGVTAWVGLLDICQPKAGETVVVSAASGAVGSVVGQIAKLKGCRAVGIAGGKQKCDYVVNELGFDACIDHRQHRDLKSMARAIRDAAPDGVDAIFENVGGVCLDGALANVNPFAKVALCGLIAGYEGDDIPIHNVRNLLVMRVKVQGFIVSEHQEHWPQALKELAAGVIAGRIKYRESIAEGLAAAPEAFIGLLHGRNFGKQLVRLA